MKLYRKKLQHKLLRLVERKDEIEIKHKGNEQNYTYHGGFDLGYLKGQMTEIENMIDEVDEYIRDQNIRGSICTYWNLCDSKRGDICIDEVTDCKYYKLGGE